MYFRLAAGIRTLSCFLTVLALAVSTLTYPPARATAGSLGRGETERSIRYARHADGARAPVVAYGQLGTIATRDGVSKVDASSLETSDIIAFLQSHPELTGASVTSAELTLAPVSSGP